MKKILLFAFCLLNALLNAQSHRDSIDILHYEINLDISTFSAARINGYTILELEAKYPTQNIYLDLYKLTTDSVKINNQLIGFTQNDTLLTINYSLALTKEPVFVQVFYNGKPGQDPQWGGFYFSNGYAYNMGVGMGDYPHGIGRYWYPCIDSFTDRATYDYYIKTQENHTAVCGGLFVDKVVDQTDSKPIYHWKLGQPVPTYLSSVAIGPYIEIKDTYNGIIKDIPVSIFVAASDSSGAINTFTNLKLTLQSFENRFGEYRWDRVGYVVVPFGGGAMEHATNTAFPQYALSGSLSDQTLAAHELAHSWFGNLVTCRTSEDMWLNEGWASYCEAIFKQDIHDFGTAMSHINSNHKTVLKTAHTSDGGYYALNNIPHHITYGKTVYDKGADVVHSLRGYLGDDLFFQGAKDYLNDHLFSDVSSYDLMQSMSLSTGTDLNAFFNNWVFQPGFPHYTVDSFVTEGVEGSYHTNLGLSQKMKYREVYGNQNRVPITLIDNNWNRVDTVVEFNGQNGTATVPSEFIPTAIFTDLDYKLNDATTHNNQVIKETGYKMFTDCDFKLNTFSISDSSLINVIYNWVLPSPFKTAIEGITLSNYHYWKIEGMTSGDFKAAGKFSYAFSTNTNPDDNYEIGATDTLVLLYRKNTAYDWSIAMKGPAAKLPLGEFYYENLKFGEYAIGYWDGITEIEITSLNEKTNNIPRIYPNPFKRGFNINWNYNFTGIIQLYDLQGQLKLRTNIYGKTNAFIDTFSLKPGIYLLQANNSGSYMDTKIIVKE